MCDTWGDQLSLGDWDSGTSQDMRISVLKPASPWQPRTVGHPKWEILVQPLQRPKEEKGHIQGLIERHRGRTGTRSQIS